MKVITALALICCWGLVDDAKAAEKPVHLFILSGQSNMAGMNPKAGFEPEAQALFPDAQIIYLKIAKGGQPIRFWVDEWNAIAEKHGLSMKLPEAGSPNYYRQILDEYRLLLKKHPRPASVTFCWMQGERDAREKLSAAHADALRQLIANLRRDLEQPNMNVVIGRLSDFGEATDADWQRIREAQVSVAKDDARGAWVDCDDLNNKVKDNVEFNDLHYTQEGYELLGRRFARQAQAILSGQSPDEQGRPE